MSSSELSHTQSIGLTRDAHWPNRSGMKYMWHWHLLISFLLPLTKVAVGTLVVQIDFAALPSSSSLIHN